MKEGVYDISIGLLTVHNFRQGIYMLGDSGIVRLSQYHNPSVIHHESSSIIH